MDYEDFFQLGDRPFKSTLEGKFFYRGEVFSKLADLLSGPSLPGVLILKGAPGTGKSTFLKRLPQAVRDSASIAPVLSPGVGLADILREALNFLGLGFKCHPSAKEEALIGFFQNAADELVAGGRGLALAVDDAQNLGPETLADLVALTSLGPGWRGRVCLLLAGPADGWDAALQGPGTTVMETPPLSAGQTVEYLRFRLRAAGARREIFAAEAYTAVHTYTKGLPPKIDALADKALMAAWAAGKPLVTPGLVVQAKASLDNPLTVDDRAAKSAAGSGREHHAAGGRSWIFLTAAVLVAAAFVFLLWPAPPGDDPGASEAAAGEEEPEVQGPDLTPAADPSPGGTSLGLPYPPPALVRLPQSSQALIVELGQQMARLWQGGLAGPGLKAEIAAPDFKGPGLYLVGRPRGRAPVVFQYPPSDDVPREAGESLWRQVAPMLPQDVLPLMVASGDDLVRGVPGTARAALSELVDKWTRAQIEKKAGGMAELYAETFSFYEPGRRPLAITRRNFWQALEQETAAAGDVRLAISDPLVMLDPRDHDRAWAVFNLKYDSKIRHDAGLRTLIMERGRGGAWLIVAELWLKEDSLEN
ncbi:MAG: AAA family ATPase [Deltaproteobacteria bacterium]|jgi:type II secretory pathway predicted ATPase ExeA|nr:AAA family ATPase [Deltaproteobacteria bacterium]